MPELKNPRHESFCRHYVFGEARRPPAWAEDELDAEELATLPPETMGSAVNSYIAAGYRSRGQAAYVGASQILSRRDIRRRIVELRDELHEMSMAERFRWSQMVPEGQRALLRVLRKSENDSAVIAAVKEILAQADGPTGIRFRDKDGKEGVALPVIVLGQSDRTEPPASFEPRPE